MLCYNDTNLFFYNTVFLFSGYVNTADINRIAKDLKITYDVVRNGVLTPYATVTYFANVTLENIGSVPIPAAGWSIYFCHHTLIQPVYYNATINQYIGGGLILSGNITLTHIKGCMFKFDPYNGDNKLFQNLPLKPGDLRNVSFLASNWAISRYDVFPNWYLSNGTHHEIIENTKSPDVTFVSPHKTFVEFMRGIPNDVMGIPPTPFERYRGYNFTDLDNIKSSILPTPLKQMIGNKTITIDKRWRIDRDRFRILSDVAKYLQSKNQCILEYGCKRRIQNQKNNKQNCFFFQSL